MSILVFFRQILELFSVNVLWVIILSFQSTILSDECVFDLLTANDPKISLYSRGRRCSRVSSSRICWEMELDTTELDLTSERVVDDLTDLVESIYNDQILFPGIKHSSNLYPVLCRFDRRNLQLNLHHLGLPRKNGSGF